MSKLNVILIGIAIFAFAAAGVNAYLGYSGNEVIASHYMTDHEWADASCGGCHAGVYEEVVNSYHVQTDTNEWSPLTNFDAEVEGNDAWVREFGQFHVGGGPMDEYGVDIDCMVCHEQTGEYDFDARADAIEAGNFEDANDIAIRDVRTSVQQSPLYIANYMLDVLTPAPMVLLVHDPINAAPEKESCATCHVEDVATGAVTWADERHEELDVHAEVECAECHETVEHQIGRPEVDAFAAEEDGHETEVEGEVLDCLTCHEGISHGPIADAHLNAVECESCHIPMLPGGELEGGIPLESFSWANGVREDTFKESDFAPTLAWSNGQADDELPMADGKDDPNVKLAPFNVVAGTWWDAGINEDVVANPETSPSTGDPIPVPHVRDADSNGDGTVTEEEMRSVDIDGDGTPDYPNAILRNVDLYYRVSHNIAGAEAGLADPFVCAGCHGSTSDVDWQFLGYEKDPAETDPPTDFTQKTIDVTVPREKPEEVEREPAF